MPHVRQQIREAVANGLTGLPTTGDRVFVGRTRPLGKGHQPALLIYTRSETSERAIRGAPPTLKRRCTLHVEGRVVTPTPPDDLLDQIASEVEAGIAALVDYGAARFLGGMVMNIQLNATEVVAEAEGETHTGGIRLEYLVTYHAVEGSPNTAV